MRRAALLTILLLLVLAAPAGAWFESAGYDVPHGRVAACLRAASPGQVSLLDARSLTTAATNLLSVGLHAFLPGASTSLGGPDQCGALAGASGVAPLLVSWERVRGGGWSDVALRVASPGGPSTTIRTTHGRVVSEPVVALAPGGEAVVMWSEMPLKGSDERLYAAVRPYTGASFGRPSNLGRPGGIQQRPGVGIDAAGRATVAWLQETRSEGVRWTPGPSEYVLEVASATPAGRFGLARRVARGLGSHVALAVLPDGHALLTADVPDGVEAYERPPGRTRFARVQLPRAGAAEDLAVALAPDGGAVVAYRNDERSVFASLRSPGGTFGRWATVVPLARSSGDSLNVSAISSAAPDDRVGRGLRAMLGTGGEVVLSWVDEARGHRLATAYAARGTLSGGMEPPQRLGGPCRSAAAAAPVTLADGQIAVAWSDNARARVITKSTLPSGDGRVHLARSRLVDGEAQATPALAAPHLSASLVGSRALQPGQQLRVRVRCEAACDVRVLARARSLPRSGFGGGGEAIWVAASTTVPAGGSAELRPPRLYGFNAAGVRDRPRTPIDVIACTPGGPLAQQLELTPPRIADPPPFPRVIDLAAMRHGGQIRVTWRTAAPAERTRFTVYTRPGYTRVHRIVTGRGRSRFAVTLHPGRRSVRRVVVYIETPAVSFGPTVSVPVT